MAKVSRLAYSAGMEESDSDFLPPAPDRPLRRGWTTGACATAAAKAAYLALITGEFPDPVEIALPGGARVAFALASQARGPGFAEAGIIKDAGDDPDVTHGALVRARLCVAAAGSGVTFRAGPGVGTVTLPGLPVPPGEPAINPVPRQMMRQAIAEAAAACAGPTDIVIEIAIDGGEALARKTLNPRLGILGGLSVLGTTGIVVPFSCAAWIHSIHRGIDVARATGLRHIAGATGATSEAAIRAHHGLPEEALIDMGDFVGGMLKYLKKSPVERITIAGGFAKMVKLGQGLIDLHSRAGSVDLAWLAAAADTLGGSAALAQEIRGANSALHALRLAEAEGIALAPYVAGEAQARAARLVAGSGMRLDVAIFDREGGLLAETPARPA